MFSGEDRYKVERAVLDSIHAAIQRGDLRITRTLVQWYEDSIQRLAKPDYNGLLCSAISKADVQILKHFLGMKIKTKPRVVWHAFETAFRTEKAEVVQLLIGENKIDPNQRHVNSSPLNLAAEHGNADLVRAVLNAGALPDGPNWFDGKPSATRPLYTAIAKKNVAVVKLLLGRGASLAEFDRPQRIHALQKARSVRNEEIYELIRQESMKRDGAAIPPYKKQRKRRGQI